MWAVRPVYIVVELAVAAATTGSYSLVDGTVSDLGAGVCSPAFCTPRAELMNGTFIVVGVLLALGALLLAARAGRAVTALLVVAGLSSVATGFFPVDDDATLHALAAAPLFVCQPLALLLLSRSMCSVSRPLARALVVTGSVTGAAAVGFAVAGTGAGLLERLALWPVLVVLAASGLVLGRGRS